MRRNSNRSLSKHDDLIFSDSLDGPMKPEWQPSMKTRFAVADGTLNGHISSLKPHFRTGASLSKKKNTRKRGDAEEVLASSEWQPRSNQWYHVLQEMRGEEVVMQIEGGPTLIAKHPHIRHA
jgi:hypothetical protein